jgi:hypothetical protein
MGCKKWWPEKIGGRNFLAEVVQKWQKRGRSRNLSEEIIKNVYSPSIFQTHLCTFSSDKKALKSIVQRRVRWAKNGSNLFVSLQGCGTE